MKIIHVDSYSPTGFLAKHIKNVDRFPERIDHYWGFRVLSRIKKNYPDTECIFIRPGVDRDPITNIDLDEQLVRKFTDYGNAANIYWTNKIEENVRLISGYVRQKNQRPKWAIDSKKEHI